MTEIGGDLISRALPTDERAERHVLAQMAEASAVGAKSTAELALLPSSTQLARLCGPADLLVGNEEFDADAPNRIPIHLALAALTWRIGLTTTTVDQIATNFSQSYDY